jgi:hypothetical protein
MALDWSSTERIGPDMPVIRRDMPVTDAVATAPWKCRCRVGRLGSAAERIALGRSRPKQADLAPA